MLFSIEDADEDEVNNKLEDEVGGDGTGGGDSGIGVFLVLVMMVRCCRGFGCNFNNGYSEAGRVGVLVKLFCLMLCDSNM